MAVRVHSACYIIHPSVNRSSSMSSALTQGLNDAQLEAVTLPPTSALVLAGAGSGKTRVLTTRIAYLIQTGQASPSSILAVTFTNKAAKEMVTRIASMLPIDTRGMWVGTFHGLCNRWLRTHHRDAGLPQLFQILDSQDQLAAIKRLLKSLNLNEEKYPPRQVQYFISGHKEEGRRAKDISPRDEFERTMVDAFALYDEQCNREGVVDFAELLLRTFEVLTRNEILRAHYSERFKFILVDEFQDTNKLQYRWLKLLSGPQTAIFAVGDDDQSIYAFRGANVGNMQDFQRDFHVQRVLKLTQNYRSHGNILDAANAIIKHNAGRLGKDLWTSAGSGEPVRIFSATNDNDEASFIVDEVKTLHAEGINLADMALLYRSNAQSRVLEHALFSAGISYRVYGGLRFFERLEIKHALAYLRLAANQDDDGAFVRVVNFPARGIGARSIEQLQDIAKQNGYSLIDAARSNGLGGRSGTSLQAFVQIITNLTKSVAELALPELVTEMLDQSGLKNFYQLEKDGADRLENLNELINAAQSFVHEAEDDSLASFLAHASLEAGEHQAEAGTDALQMMSVHAAKGLEFHAVFLSGLEEGLFPHENSMSEADGLEEERRLMYVAVTRAKCRLYVSHAESRMLHGQVRYGIRSRFVDEIPEALCKMLAPRQTFFSAPKFSSGYGSYGSYGRGRFESKPAAGLAVQDSAPAPKWQAKKFPFSIGQNVAHAKFGQGVILGCEGNGADARVQVQFRDTGVKWLALEYAKLTAA
jgi:DNA helicase II / ATP-dependent DNA helicase PcrA